MATELEVIVHRSLHLELDQVTLRHRLLGLQRLEALCAMGGRIDELNARREAITEAEWWELSRESGVDPDSLDGLEDVTRTGADRPAACGCRKPLRQPAIGRFAGELGSFAGFVCTRCAACTSR